MRLIGILLIVLGAAGLIHRGFTVTTDEEKVSVGPVSVHVEKQERVAVPVWASVAVLAAGVALILYGGTRPKSS